MKIDTHNYEEFFLLYVDNELSEAERAEVEAFAKRHPHLGEELEALKESTILPDETISFTNKDLLYKSEHSISLANRENYFIEYVNNELTTEQKNEVEKFVLQHPDLQNEFTLLQKTKLEAELIPFENKSLLYKTEKRRVIPIGFMRMAAAAAVIGLVTTLWITLDRKNTIIKPVAVTFRKQPNQQKEQVQTPGNIPIAKSLQKEDHYTPVAKKTFEVVDLQRIAVKETAKKKTLPAAGDNLNQLPVPQKEVLAFNDRQVVDSRATIERPTEGGVVKSINADYASNNEDADNTNSIVKQAVYREHDNIDEDEKTIFIGGAEINRNKLRGLFKKATNLLDKKLRRTNDDNTLHIASFELKTK